MAYSSRYSGRYSGRGSFQSINSDVGRQLQYAEHAFTKALDWIVLWLDIIGITPERPQSI